MNQAAQKTRIWDLPTVSFTGARGVRGRCACDGQAWRQLDAVALELRYRHTRATGVSGALGLVGPATRDLALFCQAFALPGGICARPRQPVRVRPDITRSVLGPSTPYSVCCSCKRVPDSL
jgi:hypothetical protein